MSPEGHVNRGEYRTTEEPLKGYIAGVWFRGKNRQLFGRKEIEYSLVDGEPIFEGDIILNLIGDEAVDEDLLESAIITGSQYRWANGIVPYEIDAALPNKARVHNAIGHWETHTIIRFVERTTGNASDYPNYIRFRPSGGCSSYVGMQGGMQPINLAPGCGLGNTIHEIGHAVGLWHEQSREDRNDWVIIHYDHISPAHVHNFNQHIADGEDIGVYDYGSIMHYGPKAFSIDGEDTITPLHGGPIGQRNGLSEGDIIGVWYMYHDLVGGKVMQQGIYTIQQRSNNRFLDAHESSANDFSVVTRTEQNNDTQRWILTPVGQVYIIQQKSNSRFMDAHESGDFSVVTRTVQNNDTQRWVLMPLSSDLCTYTIQQLSNSRFMDAHESSANDFSVVTRTVQNNDTQRWVLKPVGIGFNNLFTMQQLSSGRFVDAHESSANDFSVVTRTEQNNDTQRWNLTPVGGVYTIRQRSSGRFMDAHESGDHSVVTRTAQNNDTQRWVIMHIGDDIYTVQQLSNGRFMDAHESSANDFSVVTRTAQNNDTQRWIIKAL